MISAHREDRTNLSENRLRHWHRSVPAVGQLINAFSGLLSAPAFPGRISVLPPTAPLTSSLQDSMLSFLIHDVSRVRRSASDQFLKPLGITQTQWWVLAHLSRDDGMMQTDLAAGLGVGKASLGDILESIEGRGWVERQSDPSDKRVKRIFLTHSARSMIGCVLAREAVFNDRIFGGLVPAERAELSRMLLCVKNAVADFCANADNTTEVS